MSGWPPEGRTRVLWVHRPGCNHIRVSGRSLQTATFDNPSGQNYAANGTAKDLGSYLDIDRIWALDPDVSGLRIDVSRVIDAALALCD